VALGKAEPRAFSYRYFHQSIGRCRGLVSNLLEIDANETAVANDDAAVATALQE
jgi:hypothetical protein